MNTSCRPPDALSSLSSPPGIAPQDLPPPVVPQPDEGTWIDLPSADRLSLSGARERYGLPPEAMTYFLLRYQTAKLIHAGPALFLVTFVAVPSRRQVFTRRELKICVTPMRIVTLCAPSGKAQPELARTLPGLPSLSAGGAGRFLCGLLAGVVGSYETIVKAVAERRFDDAPREERQRWRKRVEKLIHYLRDEQVFLSNVAREGGKLFTAAEGQQLRHLEERVGVLARVAWDTLDQGKAAKGNLESVSTAQKGGDA